MSGNQCFSSVGISIQTSNQKNLNSYPINVYNEPDQSKLDENKIIKYTDIVYLFSDEGLEFHVKSHSTSLICYVQFCLN